MRIRTKEELRNAVLDYGNWILSLNPEHKVEPMRVSNKEWKSVLMDHQDTMIWNGSLVDIVGKSIGFGVTELTYITR